MFGCNNQIANDQPMPNSTTNTNPSLLLAVKLFPVETWTDLGGNVFLAASRKPKVANQQKVLDKEIVQARLLAARGSTVYLLPEQNDAEHFGEKHPDAVVDGKLIEFKTITGNIREVERRYKESRHQAENVFLKIDNPSLTTEAVLSKLIDKTRKSGYSGGMITVYFSSTKKWYFWEVDHLK
jgi:activator of 2-hydroxyglutaryl-CoA dehydratase